MKAEIVFNSIDTVRCFHGVTLQKYIGKPLNAGNTIDRKTGEPILRRVNSYATEGFRAQVVEHVFDWSPNKVHFETERQCRNKYGRRHDVFDSLTEAQESLIKWFERNFKYGDVK